MQGRAVVTKPPSACAGQDAAAREGEGGRPAASLHAQGASPDDEADRGARRATRCTRSSACTRSNTGFTFHNPHHTCRGHPPPPVFRRTRRPLAAVLVGLPAASARSLAAHSHGGSGAAGVAGAADHREAGAPRRAGCAGPEAQLSSGLGSAVRCDLWGTASGPLLRNARGTAARRGRAPTAHAQRQRPAAATPCAAAAGAPAAPPAPAWRATCRRARSSLRPRRAAARLVGCITLRQLTRAPPLSPGTLVTAAAGKSSLVLRYVKGQFFDYQVRPPGHSQAAGHVRGGGAPAVSGAASSGAVPGPSAAAAWPRGARRGHPARPGCAPCLPTRRRPPPLALRS